MGYAQRTNRDDLRRDIRYVTAFPATVLSGGLLQPVVVDNISANGALVKGEDLPRIGSLVQLAANSINVEGRVIWRRDGVAGVSFDQSIDPLHAVRENIAYFHAYRQRRAGRERVFAESGGAWRGAAGTAA